MGYTTRNIAQIKEPAQVSLAANPNFVVFEGYGTDDFRRELPQPENEIVLKINNVQTNDVSLFRFTAESTRLESPLTFAGTKTKEDVGGETFFINGDPTITALNIRACLMKNSFMYNNFDISVPLAVVGGTLQNGSSVHIRAKWSCTGLAVNVPAGSPCITVTGYLPDSPYNDSLLQGDESCEIQLDVYKDTGLPVGSADYNNMGTYATTLSKSYMGRPLWFDVNTMWAGANPYSDAFLRAEGWCDAGTMTDFRFTAKRFNGTDNETFYYSDVLGVMSGYGRTLEDNGLAGYIYDVAAGNVVKPLTRCLELTHIRGQRQYFNFVMKGRYTGSEPCRLGILYKAYTQAGSYLGSVVGGEQDSSLFGLVNTICLDVDTAVLDRYATAGIVCVCLCRNGLPAGEALTLRILPDCLYRVNDFAYLNSLGGWSSFNFGGTEQTDFKADAVTIHRTPTPGCTVSSRIESVFGKGVSEQFTVQTAPLTRQTADRLKEISASVAVYELSTLRYVIVEELTVKHNSKDDLFALQMKYRYSDAYN